MAPPKPHPMALFLSLALLLPLSTAAASSRALSKVNSLDASVMIYNQIAGHSDMKVQCQARLKVVNLRWTVVAPGHFVGWEFKASPRGGTLFSCKFVWEAMTRLQEFDVWVDPPVLDVWDRRPCTKCVWQATLDGLKAYEAGQTLGAPVEHLRWKYGYPPWTW